MLLGEVLCPLKSVLFAVACSKWDKQLALMFSLFSTTLMTVSTYINISYDWWNTQVNGMQRVYQHRGLTLLWALLC